MFQSFTYLITIYSTFLNTIVDGLNFFESVNYFVK